MVDMAGFGSYRFRNIICTIKKTCNENLKLFIVPKSFQEFRRMTILSLSRFYVS
jgi:hypothetical protein